MLIRHVARQRISTVLYGKLSCQFRHFTRQSNSRVGYCYMTTYGMVCRHKLDNGRSVTHKRRCTYTFLPRSFQSFSSCLYSERYHIPFQGLLPKQSDRNLLPVALLRTLRSEKLEVSRLAGVFRKSRRLLAASAGAM